VVSSKRRRPKRRQIGRISYYYHHGSWWVYYRDGERQVRHRVGEDEQLAEQVAAQVNAQLTIAAPTMFTLTPLTVPELCRRSLDHHQHVERSSLATIRRYRAARRHLEESSAKIGGICLTMSTRRIRSSGTSARPKSLPTGTRTRPGDTSETRTSGDCSRSSCSSRACWIPSATD